MYSREHINSDLLWSSPSPKSKGGGSFQHLASFFPFYSGIALGGTFILKDPDHSGSPVLIGRNAPVQTLLKNIQTLNKNMKS